ncbi:hypothetical protein FRC11_013485, partial [Ceratobasidium sp. 423]
KRQGRWNDVEGNTKQQFEQNTNDDVKLSWDADDKPNSSDGGRYNKHENGIPRTVVDWDRYLMHSTAASGLVRNENGRIGKGSPTSTPNSAPTSVPAFAPSVPTSAAAESQPEPEGPQVDTAPSYAAAQLILSSFITLQSEFAFPNQLDFLPGSSLKLAYTPNNVLHGYEYALTGLLTQLEAVGSYGDDEVRRTRKEAVETIKRELERKAEAWQRITEPKSEVSTSARADIDPLSAPLPGDSDEGNEQMEGASEELLTIDQPPEELLAPVDPTGTEQIKSIALPGVGRSTSPFPDAELTPSPDEMALNTPLALTPDLEPLSRSLTSPPPSEAGESNSDSDLELEEYVDVEMTSTSEDEDTDLEVEMGGNLEM